MDREIVYVGHDNTQAYILKKQNEEGLMVAQPLAAVTSMTLTIGGKLISSANPTTGPIRWSGAGFDDGEISLVLGDQTGLPPGIHDCPLVVYDPSNADGVVWGMIPLEIMEEVEGT